MIITISGKFSHEVSREAGKLSTRFHECMDLIDFSDVPSNLDGFVYFPVIISDAFPIEKKSMRSYSAKERSEFVNVEIPYESWVRASGKLKTRLMFSGLEKAIRETKKSKISEASKSLILARIAAQLGIRIGS